MRKNSVCIYNKEFTNRSHLFLQDTNSDLYVVLVDKIYTLHKSFLNQMEYFTSPEFQNETVHLIQDDIEQKWFEAVIGYYYGRPLEYQRDWSMMGLLKTMKFLRSKNLLKKVFQDIEINFEEYGFFMLLNISFVFNAKQLKKKCQEQLILMNFEQLNFNRFDLYQTDLNALQQIIKLHQLLRINQDIIGLNKKALSKIISQYCKTNKIVNMQIQQLINNCQQSARQGSSSQQITPSNSRKPSSTENTINIEQKQTINNKNQMKDQRNLKSNNLASDKRDKIYQQLSRMPDPKQNNNQNHDQFQDMHDIDQKLRKFQKTCQEQDTKYLNLKKQMDRLNSGKRKTQMEFSQQQSQQQTYPQEKKKSSSNMTKSDHKIFPQMPKLMHNDDDSDE